MKNLIKNLIIIALVFVLISGIFALVSPQTLQKPEEISFSRAVEDINQEKVTKITVEGDKITLEYITGEEAISRKEPAVSLAEALLSYGVSTEKIKGIEIRVDHTFSKLLTNFIIKVNNSWGYKPFKVAVTPNYDDDYDNDEQDER